jgi:hypothetical protein
VLAAPEVGLAGGAVKVVETDHADLIRLPTVKKSIDLCVSIECNAVCQNELRMEEEAMCGEGVERYRSRKDSVNAISDWLSRGKKEGDINVGYIVWINFCEDKPRSEIIMEMTTRPVVINPYITLNGGTDLPSTIDDDLDDENARALSFSKADSRKAHSVSKAAINYARAANHVCKHNLLGRVSGSEFSYTEFAINEQEVAFCQANDTPVKALSQLNECILRDTRVPFELFPRYVLKPEDRERFAAAAKLCEQMRLETQVMCSTLLQKKKAGLGEGVGFIEYQIAKVAERKKRTRKADATSTKAENPPKKAATKAIVRKICCILECDRLEEVKNSCEECGDTLFYCDSHRLHDNHSLQFKKAGTSTTKEAVDKGADMELDKAEGNFVDKGNAEISAAVEVVGTPEHDDNTGSQSDDAIDFDGGDSNSLVSDDHVGDPSTFLNSDGDDSNSVVGDDHVGDPSTFLKSDGRFLHKDKKGNLFTLPKRLTGKNVLVQRAGELGIYKVMKQAIEANTHSLQLEGTIGYAGYLESVLLDPAKHGGNWWLLSS